MTLNKILGGLTMLILLSVLGLQFFPDSEMKQFTESLPTPPQALVQEEVKTRTPTKSLTVESVDTEASVMTQSQSSLETSSKGKPLTPEQLQEYEELQREHAKKQQESSLLKQREQKLLEEKERHKAELRELREGNERSRAFLVWFEGYVAEKRRLLREIKFMYEIADFTAKKFVETVPNIEDRLHYIEVLKQLHDIDELSTRLADTPRQFREPMLEGLQKNWTVVLGKTTVARLVSETNRKAQD